MIALRPQHICCAARLVPSATYRAAFVTLPQRSDPQSNCRNLPPRTFFSWARQAGSPTPAHRRHDASRSRDPEVGLMTPVPEDSSNIKSKSPFYFEAGYAGWAKRPSRAFPPPFFSPPSGSFSDPLSTTNRSKDRRPKVNGEMIRGVTNGDDAMLVSDNLIGTNDGVGQWATRERGHAPLWSRLILHFWALAAEKDAYGGDGTPNPVQYLEQAYALTKEALSEPNEWFGTTTTSSALLHCADSKPVLYITQLGDCKILVMRPSAEEGAEVLFGTEDQYHYFDCPRQLGTNSPDTPSENAQSTRLEIEEDDMVLAMSDGVTDNVWEEDISMYAIAAFKRWQGEKAEDASLAEGMRYVAQDLVLQARKIAEDPFAASPFMEKAVEEGLAIEGGKMDDISVVAAVCKRRKG